MFPLRHLTLLRSYVNFLLNVIKGVVSITLVKKPYFSGVV
jgi:hypothetical protein